MNRIDRLYALVEELRAAGPEGPYGATAGRALRDQRQDHRARPERARAGRCPARDQAGARRGLHARPLDEPAAAQLHATRGGGRRRGAEPQRARALRPRCPQRAAEDRGGDARARPRGGARDGRRRSGCSSIRLPTPTPRSPRPSGEPCATTTSCASATSTSAAWRPSGRSSRSTSWSGPNGSYLTAWCHLRQDDRVFRMDRITRAERDAVAAAPGARRPGADGRRPPDQAAGVGAASRRSAAEHRHRAVASR